MKKTTVMSLLVIVGVISINVYAGAKDVKWVEAKVTLADCTNSYYTSIGETERANVCGGNNSKVKKDTNKNPQEVCDKLCDKENSLFSKGWSWSGMWAKAKTGDRCQCTK